MAVTNYTLTVTAVDLLGDAFDPTLAPVVFFVDTNLGDGEAIIDTTTGQIRPGSYRAKADSSGTAVFAGLIGSDSDAADLNLAPGSKIQYRVRAEYYDAVTRKRPTTPWTSGWFELNADANLADITAVQYAPISWQSTFTAAMESIRDQSQANLDAQITLSGIDDTDSGVAGVIGDPLLGPLTNDALTTAIGYRAVAAVNPLDPTYGAAGDDTADDRTALNSAITAAASFGFAVDLRGKTYKITDTLTVPAGTLLRNGTIHCTGTGKKALTVTGDDVTLADLSLIGRHATATASAGEYAVFAEGADASNPIRNLRLDRVSAELFGQYGVWMKHVDGFAVIRCDLGDLGYAAIIGTSAKNGFVLANRIDNVLAGFSSNGYGITFGRAETDSLTTDPHSENIQVAQNIVTSVPWNGIDLHGGKDITIEHNHVLGCKTAIAVGGSDNSLNVETFAPIDVHVKHNLCDSQVTDGSALAGIIFTGASGTVGSPTMVGTGSVVGNVVRGHGAQTGAQSGGIYLRDTSGVAVTNNIIIEPSPHGIVLYHDNYGVAVIGNTVVDHWSNTNSDCAVISVSSGYLTGAIASNVHRVGGNKSGATYKNARGYSAGSTTGVTVEMGANYFNECTTQLTGATGLGRTFRVDATFTAKVFLQDGNATAPAIAFTSDTNTGFYSSGADQIGVSVGGTRRARWLTTSLLMDYGITFATDNVSDIGSTSAKARYVRAGTAVQTGVFATGSRPTAATAGAGAMILDSTLGKPIWSDGTNWKDATGATV